MFCQNCGSKIDDGVKFCQSCGAAVASVVTQTNPVVTPQAGQTYENNTGTGVKPPFGYIGPLPLNYNDLPFHRKRWFVVLIWIIFSPVLIFIAFSGDIYASIRGAVYKEKRPFIWGILGIAGTIFLIYQFLSAM